MICAGRIVLTCKLYGYGIKLWPVSLNFCHPRVVIKHYNTLKLLLIKNLKLHFGATKEVSFVCGACSDDGKWPEFAIRPIIAHY